MITEKTMKAIEAVIAEKGLYPLYLKKGKGRYVAFYTKEEFQIYYNNLK